ncbi:hypothetical protein M3Y98_00318600 [Aphelenchoides besseyi]|nr:hypothetical protein M3Y98_00318600 [Aphelenchoides besseyi]KAI6201385.1 hypothetical protein M3Y96_00836200 [Aphelenchoides besseyi]
MSYGHTNSPAATLKRSHHNVNYVYSSEDDNEYIGLSPHQRASTAQNIVQKCTVGTSTSNEEAGNIGYRDVGLSAPLSSRQLAEQNDPLRFQHNSPLSDALLLALRRSRPNTRLFRALFQYIPLRDSPNENPHLELPLHAGDYVLVHGQMDEDQFYFGETLSGRTGLVPSNYVERIPDYVLLQNASRAPSPSAAGQSCSQWNATGCSTVGSSSRKPTAQRCCPVASSSNQLYYGNGIAPLPKSTSAIPQNTLRSMSAQHSPVQTITDTLLANGVALPAVHNHSVNASSRPASPSFTLNIQPHHTQITHDFTDLDNKNVPLPDSICPYPMVDISKVTVQEIRNPDKPRVAFPRELTVEKRFSRGALVSWLPPDDQLTAISQYHVCVDGVVKAVVPGTCKCSALIEDLALDKFVNISIRSITENGQSADAACTLAIGSEAPVAPQHVRVTNITPISACVSWYPSNSNAEHVVLLNALKIGVCPPAVFQVQLRGLTPSTIYRVSVRTKHPKAVLEQRAVERALDFKTLAKIGLPDPPSNVQVEIGPQPGTLLISWRPVTTQPRPPSRAAVHSYLVYADGRNIAQVPSATADHVLLRLADFADDPPIFITVRTRTKEGVISADSNVVRVPRSSALTNTITGVSTSALNSLTDPFKYGVIANTVPNAPLTTNSLPAAFIGSALPGVDFSAGQIPAISAPLNVMQPPGLLTTLPQSTAQQTANPLNTAYAFDQPALYLTQTGVNPLAGQLNASDPTTAYMLTAQPAQANIMTMQRGDNPNQWSVANNRRISESLFGQHPLHSAHQVHATQHPHKFLGRSSTSALLHNSATPLPKYASVLDWKQTQQPLNQYYTFHPRTLYKELGTTDEKPSVLEMENNYLLKHRQQQQHSFEAAPAYDHYGRPLPSRASTARVFPGNRRTISGSGTMSMSQMAPKLSRVRSDEFLGTRSEPDLRPMPIYADEENCRWFVALYDYNHHMSPNPNAQQEELSFFKHQLIKVYGDVDQDGFYHGAIGRRRGLVPSNMVIEIAKDDLFSGTRRLPPNEPDYHAPTGSSIADSAARRMRWGSTKSRSYDNAERRPPPHHVPGPSSNGYSSLGRRETNYYNSNSSRYYDFADSHAPSSSIRAGALAPRYPSRDYRGSYERSSSYDPRGSQSREHYANRRDSRRPEQGWDYPNDHRDTRDIREGAATVRSGERYDYTEGQQRYAPGQRTALADYASRNYDRSIAPVAPRDQWTNDLTASTTAGQQSSSQQLQSSGNQQNIGGTPVQSQPQYISGQLTNLATRGPQQSQSTSQPMQSQQQPQNPSQQQYPSAAYSTQLQKAQTNTQQFVDERFNRLDVLPTKRMRAKYDYDTSHLSPNVDAEQVELSFRLDDVITVFGEMDEDGFYVGELNGVRGLVPSNFLEEMTGNSLTASNAMPATGAQGTPPSSLKAGNAVGIMAGPTGAYGPVGDQQARPKGVMFSDTANRKPTPVRQTSQTSGKTSLTGVIAPSAPSMATKQKPSSASTSSSKPTGKKSDATSKTNSNAARKSSQAAKKDAPKKKT